MTVEPAPPPAAPRRRPPRPPKPKTAVLVVHGMGEQQPMDTIWGLVNALWTDDAATVPPAENAVYSKPDTLTTSFDLRRITTRGAHLETAGEKRVDFFEFYWANLMTGNTVKSVTDWLRRLLIRSPASVPRSLMFSWIAGLVLIGLTGILLLLAAAAKLPENVRGGLLLPRDEHAPIYLVAAIFAFLVSAVATGWLAPVAGDAARYLSATPDNVAARQTIRQAGVDVLKALHESGEYDRVIVIGHSLGAVIGYDILNFYWGRIPSGKMFAAHPARSEILARLTELEKAAIALTDAPAAGIGPARLAYRQAQRAYQAELSKPQLDGMRLWLVTDFVTLGCPLSKAEVLLAHDRPALEDKKAKREAPSCPPWLETEADKKDPPNLFRRFSYFVTSADTSSRAPHHAAVFAPVVWTNVYFPNLLLLIGDIVSGPVASQLGRGVLDVRLSIGAWVFRHLDYWRDPARRPAPRWIKALRRGANLRLSPDTDLWGAQASADEVDGDLLPD